MAAVTPSSSKRPPEEPTNQSPLKKSATGARWNILFVAKGDPIEDVIAIGIDQFRICLARIGEKCLLAARGIGSGFAICQRAATLEGRAVIGLCHTSNALPIQFVIEFLASQMILQGAVEKTIQTAIIGGMAHDSRNEEAEIWKLANEQPLTVRLNILDPPEGEDESATGLAVVVDPDRILIAEEEKFLLYTPAWNEDSIIDNEENGTILPGLFSDDETPENDGKTNG